MIQLTNKSAAAPVVIEESPIINHTTQVTIPIHIFDLLVKSLPTRTFESTQQLIAGDVLNAMTKKELLLVLESAIEQQKFFEQTHGILGAYEEFCKYDKAATI